MATTLQRKKPSNAVTDIDISSADSLSFTDLVCIHDQNQKPPKAHPPPSTSPEFLFSQAIARPGSAASSPSKISSANLLFSNGQLLPRAIQSRSDGSRRTSGNGLGQDKAAKETNSRVRSQVGKDQTERNRSFGLKVFKSFASPCRNCHALEPSRPIKVRASRQENVKAH